MSAADYSGKRYSTSMITRHNWCGEIHGHDVCTQPKGHDPAEGHYCCSLDGDTTFARWGKSAIVPALDWHRDPAVLAILRRALQNDVARLHKLAEGVRAISDAEAPFRALLDEAKRVGAVLDQITEGKE